MKRSPANRKADNQAREVLASVLLFDISDPRLTLVTITACDVSPDRGYCTVYYSCPKAKYRSAEAAFEKAAGHIRSALAQRLGWRVTPKLRFVLDETVDNAQAIGRALINDPIREIALADDEEAGGDE